MKKKFYWRLLTIMMVAVVNIGITSCGGSDDDDDNAGEQVPASSRFLVGTWEIKYDGASKEIERWLTLSADGKAVMVTNRSTAKYSGNSLELVWVPTSSEKKNGNWKYKEMTEDYGTLITDIEGWNEIDISGKLSGYWRGFNVGASSYFNAIQQPAGDHAINHMVQVGSTWLVCKTCNGSKNCTSCNGTGHFDGIRCYTCHGTGQKLTLNGYVSCPDCNGLGYSGAGQCSQCRGSGKCSSCNGLGGHYE